MDTKQIKENKFKMILGFSVPSIIAMLLQTIITITDGYFTGNYVGEDALAAINLGLPILYFYLGVGLCIGVGGSVICGRCVGAKEEQKASEVFSQTMVTSVGVCIGLSVLAFILFTPILHMLRADAGLTGYFTAYYQMMLFVYPLMIVGTTLGQFIRIDGKPQVCMLISIAGCVLNIILDYIFVAVMRMGIRGSAIGSFVVQLVTVLVSASYFVNQKAKIRFCRFQFEKMILAETMQNGFSELIGEMASAISMYTFNYVLMKYVGPKGVAAFTILGFVVYGYSMICIGFGQGIMPLISVCFGAKETETVFAIRKMTNRIVFVIGTLTAVFFFMTGRSYAGMFGCSNDVADMVAAGFRIYAVTFLVMGYDVIGSMYFTSCGDAKASALISALRGLVLLLGFTLILPGILGMTGVWLAAPCTETVTAIVSTGLLLAQKNRIEKGAL